MNKGFLNRAEEEANKSSSSGAGKRGMPWKLQMKENEPNHVKFLTKLSQGVKLLIHLTDKGATICDKMYDDADGKAMACDECEKPSPFGKGKNRNIMVFSMIGYCYDLVGKKREGRDGTEYDEDPVRIIELRPGQGQGNYAILETYASKGKLNNVVFQIKKSKDKKTGKVSYPAPVKIDDDMLGDQFDVDIPQDIVDKWAAKSDEQVLGEVLTAYKNVRWDEIGVAEPEEIFDIDEAVPVTTGKPSSRLK